MRKVFVNIQPLSNLLYYPIFYPILSSFILLFYVRSHTYLQTFHNIHTHIYTPISTRSLQSRKTHTIFTPYRLYRMLYTDIYIPSMFHFIFYLLYLLSSIFHFIFYLLLSSIYSLLLTSHSLPFSFPSTVGNSSPGYGRLSNKSSKEPADL